MTTTAEERAKALMSQFYDELEYVSAAHADDMERRITAAITSAENEKLEEAAAFVIEAARPKAFGSITVGDELNMQGAAWAATRIRSLKKD